MKVFVIEITAAIDALGNTQTFYVTDGGFATRPTDTPANTIIHQHLTDPGGFRREMFAGNLTFGPVRAAFGEAVLFNADGTYDAWADYGFDGRPFVVRYGEQGAPYPSAFTTVFVATMERVEQDIYEIRIILRDNITMLEKPVLNETFAGTGGVEGSSEMEGQAKQRTLGLTNYPPAQLIDQVARTYFIDTGTGSSLTIWDSGVQMGNEGAYSSIAELLATSPSDACYKTYFGGPVITRLGSNPTGDLRISFNGKQSDGSDWNIVDFVAEAGYTGTVTGTLDPVGHLVDSPSTTYLEILTHSAMRLGKYFGFNRLGEFEVADFAAPSGTPLYTFTLHNTSNFKRGAPDGAPVPPYKFSVNAGRAWPSSLAGAASVTRATFSRSPWYANYTYSDNSVRLKHPSAGAITLDINPSMTKSVWEALRDKFISWFFTRRDQVSFTCVMEEELFALDIGNVVEVKVPRFGFNAGKLFKIVSVRYSLKDREIDYVLWG